MTPTLYLVYLFVSFLVLFVVFFAEVSSLTTLDVESYILDFVNAKRPYSVHVAPLYTAFLAFLDSTQVPAPL